MRPQLFGLVLLAGCGEAAPARVAPPPAQSSSSTAAADAAAAPARTSSREPVVVTIVVDQLSAWVAASRWPELPEDGAFARLRREGTYVKNLRYAHAVTDTAPGHAALHTGKPPSESGIFANELSVARGGRVSILRDDQTRLVSADPTQSGEGSSAARLRADTVADRLRAARPEAFIVSVSLKDRGAILPAGKSPTWVLWFDSRLGRFVTSTAFGGSFPKWAVPIGDVGAVESARAVPWEPTDAAWLARKAATPDDQPGEGDLDGLGTTFPHHARTAAAFRALPASDAMILALVKAAVDAEHDPARPTLLSISLSASDVVGHVFGPDSWEAWDQLRKLDASLGAFLDALEAKVGPVVVMLSGDHGNVSMPEAAPRAVPCAKGEPASSTPKAGSRSPSTAESSDAYARPCTPGVERLEPDALQAELRAATAKVLGEGEWVRGLADPYVYLSDAAKSLEGAKREKLDRTVRTVLAAHKGVAEVYDVRMLASSCPTVLSAAKRVPDRAREDAPLLTLVCRSVPKDASGDYYVVPKPGSFFDAEIVRGKGSSHGTPYLYDRTVPLLVRARGQLGEGVVVTEPVDFSVFAALEARFLGLDSRPPRDILDAHTARSSK